MQKDIFMLRAMQKFGKNNGNSFLVQAAGLIDLLVQLQSQLICPYCGGKGDLVRWGYYERGVVELDPAGAEDDQHAAIIHRRVRIQRMMCKRCGHTHAVIPTGIVPYRVYSLQYILHVLQECETSCVVGTAEKYLVPVSMVYRWKKTLDKDLQYTGQIYVKPEEWLLTWEDCVTEQYLQSFVLLNGRLLLEHLRPIRPLKSRPRQSLLNKSSFQKWPAI